jgi:Bacterial regulatory proteins, gntR family
VNVPSRATAQRITWMTNMLLAHGEHALPPGLTAALRHHKIVFLAACATQPWAQPSHQTRYTKLANQLAHQITSGHLKPGQRLPSCFHLADTHHEHHDTASRALHILAIRGLVAMEASAYYVLPPHPG